MARISKHLDNITRYPLFRPLPAVGALPAAGLRHHQCHLCVHEHPQDIRALPSVTVCDVHAGHAAHVPLHRRDDRQDAHQRNHQGTEGTARKSSLNKILVKILIQIFIPTTQKYLTIQCQQTETENTSN